MDTWARVGAATGIAAVVLFAIGFFITPEPPDADASATEIADYFAAEENPIQVGVAFLAASALALIWFVGTLTSVLRRAEGAPRLSSIVFGTGVISITLLLTAVTALAVAALRPENMEAAPELAQALYDYNLMALSVGAFVLAGFYVAVGLLSLRFGALPAWLGWLALVAAVATAFGIGSAFTTDGVFAFKGVLGWWAGLVAFAAWFLAASVTLVEALGRPPGSSGIFGRVRGAVEGATAGATGRRDL